MSKWLVLVLLALGLSAGQAVAAPGIQYQPVLSVAPAGGFVNESDQALPAVGVNNPYVCFDTGYPGLGRSWGYYQYHQNVYETRHWCGYLNAYQTTRTSGTHSSSDWCSNGPPRPNYKTAGGNGYFYSTVLTGAHFECPALYPPFLPPHRYDDWQKWRCNMGGYCAFVEAGRS